MKLVKAYQNGVEYLFDEYIEPITRTLWDETKIVNSTSGSSGVIASTNGKIIRPSFSFGGGNGNYSITTKNGHTVIAVTTSHGNCHVGFSDANKTDLYTHKKVKIVYDYLVFGSKPNSYTNWMWLGNEEGREWSSSQSSIRNGNKFGGTITMSQDVEYSVEMIIDTSNDSTEFSLINGSNIQNATYTKVWNRETNSSYIINGGGPQLISLGRDMYGSGVRCGDIHIYTSD